MSEVTAVTGAAREIGLATARAPRAAPGGGGHGRFPGSAGPASPARAEPAPAGRPDPAKVRA